jgi:hypothetical protein
MNFTAPLPVEITNWLGAFKIRSADCGCKKAKITCAILFVNMLQSFFSFLFLWKSFGSVQEKQKSHPKTLPAGRQGYTASRKKTGQAVFRISYIGHLFFGSIGIISLLFTSM